MTDLNLKAGMTGEASVIVNASNTALKFGSGTVNVYATPAMVGLMENAAINAVDRYLPEGYASVGTKVEVRHLAPTPIGMEVRAEAELTEIDGFKLKFKIEAYDEKEKIGEGTHSRYVVKLSDFVKKAENKAENN
ncbi:MAG: thioesterase family protein [Actinobacteria bacterium]|nr:thioesterase family protein [Actinomycetota bacterium]